MEEATNKRGRGRPKGSRNVSVQFQHYNPKKWEPWMEALVLAKMQGKSNAELAASFDISLPHVSNILSTAKAEEIRQKLKVEISKMFPDASIKIGSIREKALNHIDSFLDKKELADAAPIAYIAQVQSIMKMTFPEAEKNPGNVTNIQNNILLANGGELLDRIAKGLEGSKRVEEIHAPKVELLKAVNE
jgi:hypothetical protein